MQSTGFQFGFVDSEASHYPGLLLYKSGIQVLRYIGGEWLPTMISTRLYGCNSFDIVCLSGCTQGTLYTTTPVYGYLCTRKAQYAPLRRNMHHGAQGRLCFLKNSGDAADYTLRKIHVSKWVTYFLLWQVGFIANVKLHFFVIKNGGHPQSITGNDFCNKC